MPEALIADSMIARQLKITEKALNRGSNNHESMVQFMVLSRVQVAIVETLFTYLFVAK